MQSEWDDAHEDVAAGSWDALLHAVRTGDAQGLRNCLQRMRQRDGTDMNSQLFSPMGDQRGITVWHEAASSRSCSRECLRTLWEYALQHANELEDDSISPVQPNFMGEYPIHTAVAMDNPNAVQYLLELGIQDVNSPVLVDPAALQQDVFEAPQQRWSPLHFAARNASSQMVRLLLEKGASAKLTDAQGRAPLACVGLWGPAWPRNNNAATPADSSAFGDVIDALLGAGATIDACDNEGVTAFTQSFRALEGHHAREWMLREFFIAADNSPEFTTWQESVFADKLSMLYRPSAWPHAPSDPPTEPRDPDATVSQPPQQQQQEVAAGERRASALPQGGVEFQQFCMREDLPELEGTQLELAGVYARRINWLRSKGTERFDDAFLGSIVAWMVALLERGAALRLNKCWLFFSAAFCDRMEARSGGSGPAQSSTASDAAGGDAAAAADSASPRPVTTASASPHDCPPSSAGLYDAAANMERLSVAGEPAPSASVDPRVASGEGVHASTSAMNPEGGGEGEGETHTRVNVGGLRGRLKPLWILPRAVMQWLEERVLLTLACIGSRRGAELPELPEDIRFLILARVLQADEEFLRAILPLRWPRRRNAAAPDSPDVERDACIVFAPVRA